MQDKAAELLSFLQELELPPEEPPRQECVYCFGDLAGSDLYTQYRVCPHCQFHYSLTARERISLLADTGTFEEKFGSLISLDPLSFAERVSYRERLSQEQNRTGLSEAAVTGICKIGGRRAVLAVLDFGFLGGSMGSVVGEKVALSFELALDKGLPVVTVITSGRTRLEEGVISLMQMAKTTEVVKRFHKKELPYLSVLANPTTGQVYASFANLADFILAEPGALIGFASMRVVEGSSDKPLPAAYHTAEAHLEHGMLDMIVPRQELRAKLALLLDMLAQEHKLSEKVKGRWPKDETAPTTSAWDTVQLARHKERPTSLDYINRIFTNFLEFHGDRAYGDDKAVVCGLAFFKGRPVVIVAQERGKGEESLMRHLGRAFPEGFRKAQRALSLAAKFQFPVFTFIDTPGAHPGLDSEERGLGNAIAGTIALMSDLPTPIVASVIGEGGSEGALALAVADATIMMSNAIFTPISPERAALLLYRDQQKAEGLASALKLTAYDCKKLGIVDTVVPEPEGGAHADQDEAASRLSEALVRALLRVKDMPAKRLLKRRYKRFRNLGERSVYYRAAVRKEVSRLRRVIVRGVRGIARLRRRRREEKAASPAKAKKGEKRGSGS